MSCIPLVGEVIELLSVCVVNSHCVTCVVRSLAQSEWGSRSFVYLIKCALILY